MLCVKTCSLLALCCRPEPTVLSLTCVGKQAKDEALDRLLWRGLLQGHHCGDNSHSRRAANDEGSHAGICHSAGGLLQSHGLLNHRLPLCLGTSASGLCLCNWCCHIQVRHTVKPYWSLWPGCLRMQLSQSVKVSLGFKDISMEVRVIVVSDSIMRLLRQHPAVSFLSHTLAVLSGLPCLQ